MIEVFGTIAMITAVWGVLLNNRLRRSCFVLWLISNAISAALHAQLGLWSLFVRDAVFFLLAIEGWRKWKKVPRSGAAGAVKPLLGE